MLYTRQWTISHINVCLYRYKQVCELEIQLSAPSKDRLLVILTAFTDYDFQELQRFYQREQNVFTVQYKTPCVDAATDSKYAGSAFGMDFVKKILHCAQLQGVNRVIVVSQSLSYCASKTISHSNVDITHFTYEELFVACNGFHKHQPLKIRALDEKEKQTFIRQHPMYLVEMSRYTVSDPLIKFLGVPVDSIVEYTENDLQTGKITEYGLIVDEI